MCFKTAQIFNVAAAKGMNYAKIVKRGKVYNCYNIHLDSFDKDIRIKQMKQMKDYINNKSKNFEEDIIGGDWNMHLLSEEGENINKIFSKYLLPNMDNFKDTISKDNDWVKRRITKDNDPDKKAEMLDFLIYKPANNTEIEAFMKTLQFQYKQKAFDILYSPPFFLNIYKWKKDIEVNDMSDHYAVLLQLH